MGEFLIIVGVLIGIWWLIYNTLQTRRRKELMEKYGDEEIVDMIMTKMMWQGQTEGQLLDSLGAPSAVDQNVLKTKTKETWKYHPTGRNRYNLRVIVENGTVVGWKQNG